MELAPSTTPGRRDDRRRAARPAPLTEVLSYNLPGERETLLLRTCLLDREAAAAAWTLLRRSGTDISALLSNGGHGMRRLAPLLYEALKRHRIESEASLLTHCRMATMRESLRAAALARIAKEVFAALEDAGIPFIVLKGSALAETVYGNPALRHSHDLEILVPEARVLHAAAALVAVECAGTEPLRTSGKLRVFHASGLPVVLRTRLFEPELYGCGWEWCADRTTEARVAGCDVRVLPPDQALHHVCVHAVYGHGRSSLQWVTDAVNLIRRGEGPASGAPVSWTEFTAAVEHSRSALPAATALGYLARKLDAEIPAAILEWVERRAAESTELERDVALRCLWWGRPRRFARALVAASGPVQRVRLAWRILVPSSAYAAYRSGGKRRPTTLARYYVRRAVRQTSRLLAGA